jgi:quinol-cytochrome oxidoreductase complex cytochrome b subunit
MASPEKNAAAWGWPRTDIERARVTRKTFVFHLRPIRLPRTTLRWTHTFGLGGSSLVLWLALACTGMLMLLVYRPDPAGAYDSVRTFATSVRFGPLVRGVHYWSANLLIVVILLHVARVVLTGGYHRPRRFNWIVGTGLISLILAAAFTGYLLTWDQRAYWAITISTGMLAYIPWLGDALQQIVRGGPTIGPDTLLTFYTFHTTVLPALAIGLMALHFWRVRKAGGVIEPPTADPGSTKTERTVMFFPDLLLREVCQALIVLAIVVLLGAWVGAPMGERANPGMSPNPAKAPWYFMGFQEMLIHLHPIFAVLVLPLVSVAGFVALPWLGDDHGPAGRWFLTVNARRAAGIAAITAVVICVAGVVLDDAYAVASTGGPSWFLRGVLPTSAFAVIAIVVTLTSRRWFGLGRNESVQALAVFLAVTFVTLTVIGVFFRGEGMALTTPWQG